MPTPQSKIIIDTNLWISYLLTKDVSRLDKIIAGSKLTLVFSEELINEFVEVTQRKKFVKYFPLDDVEKLLIKIKKRAIFISVVSKVSICRDVKDNFLLALALDSNATHLLTGDKDLLVLKKYGNTKILTLTDYISETGL